MRVSLAHARLGGGQAVLLRLLLPRCHLRVGLHLDRRQVAVLHDAPAQDVLVRVGVGVRLGVGVGAGASPLTLTLTLTLALTLTLSLALTSKTSSPAAMRFLSAASGSSKRSASVGAPG